MQHNQSTPQAAKELGEKALRLAKIWAIMIFTIMFCFMAFGFYVFTYH